MSSKKLLLVGAIGAGVLSVMAVVAAATEVWWLLAFALTVLLSAGFIAALDADRRVISLQRTTAKDLKRVRAEIAARPKGSAEASEQNILGSVRLLQAQYTGRLDRMQTSIENSLKVDPNHSSRPNELSQSAE